jgi:succinate-semialdehyde dehydrogenase/glutarate-semialdehyde dehydrogenase
MQNMYDSYGLFIDGGWRPAYDAVTLEVIDPATEEVVGCIPRATAKDVDDALQAAARGFEVWKRVPAFDRSQLLRRFAKVLREHLEETARLMSRETGKPLAEACAELGAAEEQFEWYAEEAKRIYGHTLDGRDAATRLQVRYDPIGPVAALAPWNFPALLPARKIAAALAAGCSVVMKPSEEAPGSTFAMAEAAKAAGLPNGALNVLVGDPAQISGKLLDSSIIRKVSFTGSVRVGREIMKRAAQGLKKVSLEMGGHAPVLIFEDADPEQAAQLCLRTKFRNAGQVCISPSRFYVHISKYDAFSRAFAEGAKKIVLGPGLDPGVEMGPMANARGLDRAEQLVADALCRGAELLAGGRQPEGIKRGFFFEPTVLGNVPDEAKIMQEEPFVPIAPISAFETFDEVIRRANSLPYGLAGYVFTRSLGTATRASEALEVGMVGVNDLLLATAEMPFGGIKSSGMGREGGRLGILDYLDAKYTKFRLV